MQISKKRDQNLYILIFKKVGKTLHVFICKEFGAYKSNPYYYSDQQSNSVKADVLSNC